MRTRTLIPTLAAVLLLGFAGGAHAQVIHGHLLESETGVPIEGGTLTLLTEDSVAVQSVLSDEAGAFELTIAEEGGYRLSAQRIGYRSATSPVLDLEEDDVLEVEFRVSTEAVVLQPLVVIASADRPNGLLSGFYDRMERRAFGTFFDREDIEDRHPIYPSDLLRTAPGVTVVPTWFGRSIVLMRGRCVPQIYLDGIRVLTASVDELVNVMDLEGIEVYRSGLEVPPEYASMSSCGAILLWTRRGN